MHLAFSHSEKQFLKELETIWPQTKHPSQMESISEHTKKDKMLFL